MVADVENVSAWESMNDAKANERQDSDGKLLEFLCSVNQKRMIFSDIIC